jgi:hypothetical protein
MNATKRTRNTSKFAATGPVKSQPVARTTSSALSLPAARSHRTAKRKVNVELILEGGFAKAYEQMLSKEELSEQEYLRLVLKDGICSHIEAEYPSIHRKHNLNRLMKAQSV